MSLIPAELSEDPRARSLHIYSEVNRGQILDAAVVKESSKPFLRGLHSARVQCEAARCWAMVAGARRWLLPGDRSAVMACMVLARMA